MLGGFDVDDDHVTLCDLDDAATLSSLGSAPK